MTYISKVGTARIEDDAVTTQKIATGAVTANEVDLTGVATLGDIQTITATKTLSGGAGLELEDGFVNLRQSGNVEARLNLRDDGYLIFSDGTNPADAQLYREDAGRLETLGEIGGVVATAATPVFTGNVSGDIERRLSVQAGGKIEWGDGINPADANLYRNAPGEIRTDTTLNVGGQLTTTGLLTTIAGQDTYAGINFLGSTGNLYTRNRTDAVTNLFLVHGRNTLAEPTYVQDRAGKASYGDGTNPVDTTLYRSAASTLKTDGNFVVDGNVALGSAITDLIGLYGVAAVAQAAAIAPPAAQTAVYVQADVQSIADAVDDIRTVLAAIGITA